MMHFPESSSILKMEAETWDEAKLCFVNIWPLCYGKYPQTNSGLSWKICWYLNSQGWRVLSMYKHHQGCDSQAWQWREKNEKESSNQYPKPEPAVWAGRWWFPHKCVFLEINPTGVVETGGCEGSRGTTRPCFSLLAWQGSLRVWEMDAFVKCCEILPSRTICRLLT